MDCGEKNKKQIKYSITKAKQEVIPPSKMLFTLEKFRPIYLNQRKIFYHFKFADFLYFEGNYERYLELVSKVVPCQAAQTSSEGRKVSVYTVCGPKKTPKKPLNTVFVRALQRMPHLSFTELAHICRQINLLYYATPSHILSLCSDTC